MRFPVRKRGQAAVEMAVTMVLLVPLIMYTLFLEDLLTYKLENQEPTIVAGWDYLTPDYQKNSPDVQGMNRLKYCDHSAAYDSYEHDYDCDDSTHHEAGTAHECWIVPGAEQVTCYNNTGFGDPLLPGEAEFMTWSTQFNKGGRGMCTAKLAVVNYFLPQRFFNWAASPKKGSGKVSGTGEAPGGAQAEVISKEKRTGDIHSEAGGAPPATWFMVTEKFSVMSDPWALNHIDATSPSTIQLGHPFYDRASVYFDGLAGGWMADGNKDAKQYREDLKELIGDNAAMDLMGDDPATLPLTWKPELQREVSGDYASGYKDSRMASSMRNGKGNKYPW